MNPSNPFLIQTLITDLEKTVSFFNAIFSVLMASENLMNETQLIRDSTSAIGAACDSICTNATIIQLLIAVSGYYIPITYLMITFCPLPSTNLSCISRAVTRLVTLVS